MPVLNLRDVPEELMRELRAAAALEGGKFHPFCIELLERGVRARQFARILAGTEPARTEGPTPTVTAAPAPPENLELEIT